MSELIRGFVLKTRPFVIFVVLSVCGIVLSLYSLYHHVLLNHGLQTTPSFCNINAAFNCDAVNSSAWANLGGFPIASFGLAFYAIYLLVSGAAALNKGIARGSAQRVLLALSVGAVAFSVYLFIVSKFIIGTFCLVCLALYGVNLALFGVSFLAGRPTSLTTQLVEGIGAIARFPLLAFGLGRFRNHPGRNLACVGLAAMLGLTVALLTQPQKFILASAPPLEADSPEGGAPVDPVAAWKAAYPVTISENTAPGPAADHSQGPSDAPIKLVEFSDFECPACRRFYVELHDLLPKYGASLRITHRNFPIDQTCNVNIPQEAHLNSCFAALFTRCAGEQGRFWEAVDFVFTLPAIDADEPAEDVRAAILAGAGALGLDTTALEECLASDRQQKRILEDIDAGMELGLEATPSVWINGRAVKMPTGENLEAIFDLILAEASAKTP